MLDESSRVFLKRSRACKRQESVHGQREPECSDFQQCSPCLCILYSSSRLRVKTTLRPSGIPVLEALASHLALIGNTPEMIIHRAWPNPSLRVLDADGLSYLTLNTTQDAHFQSRSSSSHQNFEQKKKWCKGGNIVFHTKYEQQKMYTETR